MTRSRLVLAFILPVCAQRAAAQTPSTAPLEVIRLTGGSSIVGRVTATGDGRIHMFVDGLGEVVIEGSVAIRDVHEYLERLHDK